MKILINALDDEQIIGEFLTEIFCTNPRIDFHFFTEAKRFIEAFSKDVALIITDARVPGYNFHETLKQFKRENPGVYIIVITGYCDENFLLPLFRLRVDDVIPKDNGIKWLKELENAVYSLLPNVIRREELLA